MNEEEKINEEAPVEEEGGFFLESLTSMESIPADAEAESPLPKYPKPDSGIFTVDPNRAIRELRERQRKLEKLITLLTGVILLAIVSVAVVFQTNILERVEKPAVRHGPLQCDGRDRDSDECLARRRKSESTWSGIERGLEGKSNHFSLHNQ